MKGRRGYERDVDRSEALMQDPEGTGRGWSRGKRVGVVLAVASVIAVLVLLAVSAGGGGGGGLY
ncbi:MAG TPA: hypothetical protein VJ913_03900 [Actinomycetota bacterium]|nr:hypothetical protein [Actinomycetota bacterium]